MHPPELAAFILAIAALFASAELLRRRGISADTTRRYTHATGAAVAALLPGLISLAECVGLGLVVAGVLAWTRTHGFLASVHGIERPTLGAILFPVGISLAAILTWTQPIAYVLGALTLALADSAASLAGQRIRGPRWRVLRGSKSVAGSVAFLGVTLAIALAARALGAPLEPPAIVGVALTLTLLEGMLGFGLDNLALPPIAALAWRAALGL